MRELLRLIASLYRLESGPECMPYSIPFLIVLLLLQFLLAWYQFALQADIDVAALQTAVFMGMFVAFTFIVMSIAGLAHRTIQTLTALVIANVGINLLHLPAMIMTPWVIYPEQNPTVMLLFTVIVLMYIISLNLWLIAITAHIFSKALSTHFLTGLLVTIAMLGMNVIIFTWLLH